MTQTPPSAPRACLAQCSRGSVLDELAVDGVGQAAAQTAVLTRQGPDAITSSTALPRAAPPVVSGRSRFWKAHRSLARNSSR